MRSRLFVFMMFTAIAVTACAHAERVECALRLAELFANAHSELSEQIPASFEEKKEAFLAIYRAATEGLSIKELQGLSREPFDFKDFVDATNLSRAGEKLKILKDQVLPRLSFEEQRILMSEIQKFLTEKISRTQASQKKWNEKREKETKSANILQIANMQHWIHTLAFSPDGTRLAAAGWGSTIKIWNPDNLSASPLTLNGNSDTIHDLAFSPDGKTLVTGSANGQVSIWNLTKPKRTLWNFWGLLKRFSDPIALTGHKRSIYSVAFSPDGKLVASADDYGNIRLWHFNHSATAPTVLGSHAGWASSVAFSPDGETLASAGADKAIRLWNFADSKTTSITLTTASEVHSIAFSPDGTQLASGDAVGMVRIYNLTKPLKHTSIALKGHSDSVLSVAFSADGTHLASGSRDNTLRVWNLANISSSTILRGHSENINSVAFSPDGKTLASAGADKTIRLWPLLQILGHNLNRLEEDAP